jgi:hypothetical protein
MKKLKLKDKSSFLTKKPVYQSGGAFSGGNYYGAEYLPFVQTPSNIQMPTYISKATFQQAPIQAPQLDLESIQKELVGKGHTNDVNAYIQTKINAQQEISNLIATYGSDVVNIPNFSSKIASLQVNPAELNELIVRKEMSKEYSDQNKANGGQAEWVTAADGTVFGQDNRTGKYGYFRRIDVAAGIASPITSSDAIKLNDVDKALINDKELMSKVAQTWGGEKAFEHVNKNMDKLGKEQWLSASERLGGVDKLGDFLLYGEIGSEQGANSNAKNISTLYKSFMDTMDQSALNYIKNQALDRVMNTKGGLNTEGTKDEVNARANEYNQLVERETNKIVWDYMQKALDVGSVSKTKVSYNDAYTQAKSTGGGGPMDPRDIEFLHNFTTPGSFREGIDEQGNMVIDNPSEDVQIVPNGYRLFNDDGTYQTLNSMHYGIRLGETADRVMQKTDIGLYSVNGLPNLKLAGQPIKIEGDAFAFGSQANLMKRSAHKKDAYGRIIPGQFQNASSAVTKVLVHEDQLKNHVGTVKGADGKFLRGKILAEDKFGFSGSEKSTVGEKIPGITNVGSSEGDINTALDNFQVTDTQRTAILKSVDRRPGNWYMLDIEVPVDYTTATEKGQQATPLTKAMGVQYFGTAQQSQAAGINQGGTENWATYLIGN